MRFRVAVDGHFMAFEYSNSGEGWNAVTIQIPFGAGSASECESRAIKALRCIGRAVAADGVTEWIINRDDLSGSRVIDLCTGIAFSPKHFTTENCINRVIANIWKFRGISPVSADAQRIHREITRSFWSNVKVEGQL